MKKFLLVSILCLTKLSLVLCQSHSPSANDTLFYQNFDADTFDIPLNIPIGNDQGWINFDEDGTRQVCFEDEDTFGWFPYFDVNDSSNFTFTSCSFNRVGQVYCPANKPNRNWLIMPPVFISHEKTFLEWKALSIQGPMFHDGYRVLVSTTDNFTSSFNHELFRMAENLIINPSSSLDPAAHTFSPGYIQADRYTNGNYFTTVIQAGFEYLQGKLEPHAVSLAPFVGKMIYIAILHDADCDFGIQIDDLLVVDKESSSVSQPVFTKTPMIFPNPAHDAAWLELETTEPHQAVVNIFDVAGKLILTQTVQLYGGRNTLPIRTDQLGSGLYRIVIQTPDEIATSIFMVR
jgi:hypothetical protein